MIYITGPLSVAGEFLATPSQKMASTTGPAAIFCPGTCPCRSTVRGNPAQAKTLRSTLEQALLDPQVKAAFDIFGSDLAEEAFAGVFDLRAKRNGERSTFQIPAGYERDIRNPQARTDGSERGKVGSTNVSLRNWSERPRSCRDSPRHGTESPPRCRTSRRLGALVRANAVAARR